MKFLYASLVLLAVASAVVSSFGLAAETADQGLNGAESAASASETQSNLSEVVVTAQKRSERIVDVPISLSVLTGAELDQSTFQGISDALSTIPGVSAVTSQQSGGTLISVRGVSANGPVFGGASPIGYYLDSIPFGLVQVAIAPDSEPYDLDRVEVLRGPQGTLYGASAEGGVIRILTHDADLDKFEFKARIVGSDTQYGAGNVGGDFAVNLPLVEDKLAVRAVVGYEDLSGWISSPDQNHLNDAILRNYRLKVNAAPTDDLTVGLSYWSSHQYYGAPPEGDENRHTNATLNIAVPINYDAYGITVGYDTPWFTVSSKTGYLTYSANGNLDLFAAGTNPEHIPLYTGFEARAFSEELNVNSTTSGPWRWSAGAIYRYGSDTTTQSIPNIFSGQDTNNSSSYAVFGELSRRFLDEFEWTVGGRYFHDDVVAKEDPYAPPAEPPYYQHTDASFHRPTPRVVLAWHPETDSTVYASYSEGFRSGIVQIFLPAGFPTVEPDKLYNYEVGAKGDLDEQVSFDTAVYYIHWVDVQQQLTVPYHGTFVTALVNASAANGAGVDAGLTFRPVGGLELGATFNWNDLRVERDVISQGVVLFYKGDRLNFSPEYTAGLSAAYVFPIDTSGYKGRFALAGNYTSSQGFRSITGDTLSNAPGDRMIVARTSFTLQAPDHWDVRFFADNLFNEQNRVYGSPFAGQPVPPDTYVRIRPRTVGVQLDYHY